MANGLEQESNTTVQQVLSGEQAAELARKNLEFTGGRNHKLTPAQRALEGIKGALSKIKDVPIPTVLPGYPTLTPNQVGQGLSKAAHLVTEPVGDVVALGKTLIDMAGMVTDNPSVLATAIQNPGNPAAPAVQMIMEANPQDLPPEEQAFRAQRGLALVGGALVTGGMGSTMAPVLAAGKAALTKGGTLGLTAGISRLAATGIAEGAAFGSTYGALEPLSEEDYTRTENIFSNAVTGAAFFGLLRGVGAGRILGRTKRPPDPASVAVQREAMEALFENSRAARAERILSGNRPMPPEATIPEELVSQVAAGVTRQGVNNTGFFSKLGQAQLGVINRRFPDVLKVDKSTWQSGHNYLQSRVHGAYQARRMGDYVVQGLTDEEHHLLGRALVSSRGRAIKSGIQQRLEGAMAKGDVEGIAKYNRDLARVNIADLSLTDEMAFRNNPRLQEALGRWQNIAEEITEIRTRNGLRTLQETDLPFMPLVRASEEEIAAGELLMEVSMHHPHPKNIPGVISSKVTPGAQRATGAGEAYITDIPTILERTLPREFAGDTYNEFLANVVSAPWAKRLEITSRTSEGLPIYARAPKTIKVDGVEYPTKVVEIKGNPTVITDRFGIRSVQTEAAGQPKPQTTGTAVVPTGRPAIDVEPIALPPEQRMGQLAGETVPLLEGEVEQIGLEGFGDMGGTVGQQVLGRYVVPKPVAAMFEEFTLRPREELLTVNELKGVYRGMDFTVGMLLASPVEVTAHAWRINSVLSRLPGVGDRFDQLTARLVPYFGPKLSGMRSIFNVWDDPLSISSERMLAKTPGGLTSRFGSTEFRSGLGGLAHRIDPRLATGLETGRKVLFELPEVGEKGFSGFDVRARIVATNMLRKFSKQELGREPSSFELTEFIKQFGQYTEEMQTNLIAGLRRNRLAPFAGGQAGIIPGEIRSLFGGLNLPKETVDQLSKKAVAQYKAEVLWRGVIGTTVALASSNRALSGKWPWENEEGKMLDLDTGLRTYDGRAIYAPFTLMAPGISRAMSVTTSRAALEQFGDEGGDYVTDATRRLANLPLTYGMGSPGLRAAFVGTTGRTPFLSSGGDLLRIVPPQPTWVHTIKERGMETLFLFQPHARSLLWSLQC